MVTFLTSDKNDLERCRHSLLYRQFVTITAAVGGTIRVINGVAMAIEPVGGVDPPTWKISIEEDPFDPPRTVS